MGLGSVQVTPTMLLTSVLHVPNLDCNLLSISKLTRDLKCVTKIFPTLCEFQDTDSGTTIGSAELCSGLYLLNGVSNASSSPVHPHSGFSSRVNNESEIMLWHFRLGHPNFVYLAKLFPALFVNKDVHSFQCEICQLAKHTRTSFPRLLYRSSRPFALIHSDIWGPSRVTTITGTKWFVSFVDDHTRLTWIFLIKEKSTVGPLF